MELSQLWGLAQAGEQNAVEALFAQIRGFVLTTRTSRSLGAHDKEDVAQDVATSILDKLRWLPYPRNIGAFLGFRAWSASTTQRRRRERLKQLPLETTLNAQDTRIETPVLQLIRRENIQALRACVSQLPAQQRECVSRRFTNGESTVQIADSLGVSSVTIHKRINSAFSSLRACLSMKGVSFA